jgi:hypothetical protein
LLTEAVRLRETSAGRRKERFRMPRSIKWASVLVVLMMVFGSVFGAGQAAADSLPGQFLYEVKLAAEQVRLGLTTDPEVRAELNLALAEERLNEIAEMLDLGETPDAAAFDRARQQLETAMGPAKYGEERAPEWAFQKLMVAIQRHRRDMDHWLEALPEADQTPVRQLVRTMERVRSELHTGEGEPEGQQERNRLGAPPEGDELPEPYQTPGPHRTPTDEAAPGLGPGHTGDPGSAGQSGQGSGAGSGSGAKATPQPGEGGPGSGQSPGGPDLSTTAQPGDGGQHNNPSPGPGNDSRSRERP